MTDMLLLNLEAAARTDVGVVRRGLGQPDEDTVLDARFRDVRDPQGVRGVFAVADGQSHTRGGKVASAQCANMLEEGIEHYARRGESSIPGVQGLEGFLRYVVERIDYTLRQSSENNVTVQGMGTTLTAAVIDGNTARILHAGDSRAYLLMSADRSLRLLTHDEVADAGGRLVPTNGLGCVADGVRPNTSVEALADGDVMLLCTDGLYREIDDALIQRILCGSPTAAAAADRLIRAANHAGGNGNIGVVVVHVGRTAFPNDAELDRLFPLAGAVPPGRPAGPSAIPMPIPGTRARSATEDPTAAVAVPGTPGLTRVAADTGAARVAPAATVSPEPPQVDPWAATAPGRTEPSSPAPYGGDPRRIVPPVRPPGSVVTSPFMAALAGLVAGLILMGLVWLVASRRGDKKEATVAAAPLQTVPVNLFFDLKPPFQRAKVAYRRTAEDGQEEWTELTPNQQTEVPMVNAEDGEADLFLRLSPTYDFKTGVVRPTMPKIKIGRTAPLSASASSAAGNGSRQRGSIEVTQKTGARVILHRVGRRDAVAEHSAKLDSERGVYTARFEDLELGEYEVTNGVSNEKQKVKLTADEPARPVEFTELGENPT